MTNLEQLAVMTGVCILLLFVLNEINRHGSGKIGGRG